MWPRRTAVPAPVPTPLGSSDHSTYLVASGPASPRACRAAPVIALPAPAGVMLLGRERAQVDADHGLAQTTGDLGDHVRALAEGGGLDDGSGPGSRVA